MHTELEELERDTMNRLQGSAVPTSRRLHNNDLVHADKFTMTGISLCNRVGRTNSIKQILGRRPNRQFPLHRLQAGGGPAKTGEQKKCMR